MSSSLIATQQILEICRRTSVWGTLPYHIWDRTGILWLKPSGHENIWERSRFIALRWVIDRYRVGFVRRRFSWILSRLKENVTKREKTDFSEEKYIKNRQNCSSKFRVSHFIWFLGQVWVLKWENGSKIKIKFNVKWTGIIKGQIQIEFIPRWQKVSRDYSTLNSRFFDD